MQNDFCFQFTAQKVSQLVSVGSPGSSSGGVVDVFCVEEEMVLMKGI